MSLFDYASEKLINELEKNKSPMLTISMGREPVMPMAQGGGLSTVQNSLNINGEPHRLAYINPSEKNLLQQLGGSGRKIDGIPAYYAGHGAAEGTSEEGAVGPGEDSGTGDGPGAGGDTGGDTGGNPDTFDVPSLDPPAPNPDTFDIDSFPDLDVPAQNPDIFDPKPFPDLNRTPYADLNMKNKDPKSRSFIDNINPVTLLFSPLATLAKATVTTAVNNNFGMDPMGVDPNVGHAPSEDDDDDGTDAGGDDAADYIIKEKIAAVKQIPVKEVTVEEVQRAKRLTAAQRVAGTRLEDILDDIYGSGQGSNLLSLAQSGGGIASLQKNININGQPHQLSYINPSEENLLKQLGGSGEKINGIPAYMMGGANGDHGYGEAPGGDDSTSTDDAAAGASASGGGDQAGGDDAPPEPEPVVAPKAPEVIIPKVEEPEPPKQPRTVNTNLADILQATYPNLSRPVIRGMLGGETVEEDNEEDLEEDFKTDEKIISLLKKEGNLFPTPEDIQKYKSELNMKFILTQVYGDSNLLNNTGTA